MRHQQTGFCLMYPRGDLSVLSPQVNLTVSEDALESFLGSYEESGEWDVVRVSAERGDTLYVCCSEEAYPIVSVNIIRVSHR